MVRLAMLLGVLTILLIPTAAGAQQSSTEPTRVWLAVGLGGGFFSSLDGDPNDPGIALLGALVLKEDRHRVALRGTLMFEILEDGVAEVGLLYGRAWTRERSQSSLSAGLALVYAQDCHGLFGGPCDPSKTVGLPLSATMSFHPASFLGLGLEAFANLNRLTSFVGVTAMLELGALR